MLVGSISLRDFILQGKVRCDALFSIRKRLRHPTSPTRLRPGPAAAPAFREHHLFHPEPVRWDVCAAVLFLVPFFLSLPLPVFPLVIIELAHLFWQHAKKERAPPTERPTDRRDPGPCLPTKALHILPLICRPAVTFAAIPPRLACLRPAPAPPLPRDVSHPNPNLNASS